MKPLLKIATILPYKENYTFSKAQAAAIWVCDFYKFSKHKNRNYIYGIGYKVAISLHRLPHFLSISYMSLTICPIGRVFVTTNWHPIFGIQ